VATESRRRWTYTVYHDEPDEASTESATKAQPFVTEQDAIDAATKALENDGHWHAATVEVGDWHPADHPHSPAYWDERDTVAYIAGGVVDRA
jgi:hypothetical protein